MATYREWQRSIVERLQALLGSDRVFEESVPEIDHLPMNDLGMVEPYAVLWFGQRVQGGPGFNSVCGTLGSAHRALFYVGIGAPTGEVANDVAASVTDSLRGFRPVGQGELIEDFSPTIREPLDMSGVNPRVHVRIAYSGIIDV